MKTHWILFSALLFTSSCATLLNNAYTVTQVETSIPGAKLVNGITKDTVCCTPTAIALKRNSINSSITVIKDHTKTEVLVKPKNDPYFIYGNTLFYPFGLVGHIIDFTSNKRYKYPNHIMIDMNKQGTGAVSEIHKVRRGFEDISGFKLTVGAHLLNNISHRELEGISNHNLAFGGVIGLEQHLGSRRFIEIELDFLSGVRSYDGWDSNSERNIFRTVSQQSLDLRFGRKFHRWNFGFGPSLVLRSRQRYTNLETFNDDLNLFVGVNPMFQYAFLDWLWLRGDYRQGIYTFGKNARNRHFSFGLSTIFKIKLNPKSNSSAN